MERKHAFIFLAILSILVSSLACGLFGGGDETNDTVSSPETAVGNAPQEDSSEQQITEEQASNDQLAGQSEMPPPPVLDLGDEFRSEEGGYAFQPIPEYKFEEFLGLATMIAPDAHQDLGPLLMLIGGNNEEELTGDEIFNDFLKDAESEEVEILDQSEIIVDGKSGLLADIAGVVDGKQIVGRIVVVAVTPTQQFTMFASAPQDRWSEIQSSFDRVLTSVHFFAPQEIDLSEEFGDIQTDQGSSDGTTQETPVSDFPALADFPTDASQLPAGNFAYILAGDQGFPLMISGSNIQDQSTDEVYSIGLVSEDQQTTLTLLIPFNAEPGILTMVTFDPDTIKGPGALVFDGLTQYTNTDGIIMMDEMIDNTITGSVYFTSVDEDGNQIAVTGFFNSLPLPTP